MRLVVVEEQALVELIRRAVQDAIAAHGLAPAPERGAATAHVEASPTPAPEPASSTAAPFFPQHSDVVEWHIYLVDNGQRVAEVAATATHAHVQTAVAAAVGSALGLLDCVALPRYAGEEYARDVHPQRFSVDTSEAVARSAAYSRTARQKLVASARQAWARRARSAAEAPAPTAFFSPVPEGVETWALDVDGVEVARVPAEATLVEVATAVQPWLTSTPLPVAAVPVAPDTPDFDTGVHRRVFSLTLEDTAPPRFAPLTPHPWLSIEASPWLPPTRVPAYSTRREVVLHVCAVAASEWLDEVRTHGLTLNVQPLNAALLPVDAAFTISLFPPEFR